MLENTIKIAHDEGFDKFTKLPMLTIYQWLSKIFYGLLFRELSLLQDRTDPSLGSILPEQVLREFATLHHFLQSVRLPFVFRGFQPWSIFLFRLLDVGGEHIFDYQDFLNQMTFSIRMGEIGIIACLEDAGIHQTDMGSFAEKISSIALHPLQFGEFAAQVTYSRQTMTRTPTYIISQAQNASEPTVVHLIPIMGLSTRALFDEWDTELYAYFLHIYWNKFYEIPFDRIFCNGLVRSLLIDDEQKLLRLNEDVEIIERIDVG